MALKQKQFFELINEYNAYNQFINYYIHNKSESIETITKFITLIITCINNPIEELEEIQIYINRLRDNIIFKIFEEDKFHIYNDDISEEVSKAQYIENTLNKLINLHTNKPLKESTSIRSNDNINIKNWYEFVNIGIKIIKYMLNKYSSKYNLQDVISVLNIPVEIQKMFLLLLLIFLI